jgi:acetolactate synthase-1/2/3 large subunit
MKVKVSDFITNFLIKNGLDTVFTITGGFAMHLNDSFGKNPDFDIYYQHHEQACGYSATGFTKTNSKPCIVCTTAGVAATNAISPCLVAHQDSLPVLFISGQSKSIELTRTLEKENPKMKLRHYAGQDCDIISMVKPITKYAYEITNIEEIKDVLIEAIKHMINGRPGPVWISIPVDIQGYFMEELEIPVIEKDTLEQKPDYETLENIKILLAESQRPVIIAGNGIKMGLCNEKFNKFLEKYKIPVVVTFHGTDLIESDNPLYVGKIGLIGDRAGNFAVQNCDLLISLGCRMAQGIVGYNKDTFAREAKIVYIDNDENELEKENVNYTLKSNMDLNLFFDNYDNTRQDNNNQDNATTVKDYSWWVGKCNHWKNKWQFELPSNALDDSKGINPYYALKTFFDMAPENKIIITSSGSIITNVWHMVKVKKNDKFIISSQGDMGFEMTAAIGSVIAEKEKLVIPILGEGSFQFNIQELQTIVHKKIPMKILLMNNNSYGANVITQSLYFKNKYGSDNESDLSFPSSEKIANAYGIKYICARKTEELEQILKEFLNYKETIICEVFSSIQQRVPKLSAVKNEDGTFSSRPFEDMDPFLSREEFEKEMIVGIV